MKTTAPGIDAVIAELRARHGIDPLASVAMTARFERALEEVPQSDDVSARARAIAARLRVGETRFFRDPEQLVAVAAELAERGAPVRVLSAGCSTGEEAYTVAMMLAARDVAFTVTGIDASAESIAVARAARYAAAAALPAAYRRFVEGDAISGALTSRCRFMVGDLLTTPLLGPYDAIVCRNVLIYLEEAVAQALLARLAGALPEHGALVVARAEVPLARRSAALSARTASDVVLFGRR